MLELANMSDFITSRNNQSNSGVKMEDIQTYLRNPSQYNKQIRNTSIYLTNKHGVLRDAMRTVKSLPTLKYSLNWTNNTNKEDISKEKKVAQEFLDEIDVTKLLRDGLEETALLGTTVTCLRSRKYVQFLDIDELSVTSQRNGKWVVHFDLRTLDSHQNLAQYISTLPPEVTIGRYNAYRNKRDDSLRYVELKNCHVQNIDARRGEFFGKPLSLGAWQGILQKEMIDNVEKSVSNRLLRQLLVLSASWLDKDETRPVPREILAPYFKEVSNLVQKQEGQGKSKSDTGVGTIALPHYLKLEALKVDATMFKRELYDKINNDIFTNLGISESLISGRGGNFSSANINTQKLSSFIFTILEQFETAINDYLKLILSKDLYCRIKFDRTTVLDKKMEIDNKRELYLQTSLISPYLEAVLDAPINDIVTQRLYEDERKLDEIFYPAQNAHTSSSKEENNKPSKTDGEIDNENTMKSKSSGGNDNPSPSD